MVFIIAGEKDSGKTNMILDVFLKTGIGKGVITIKRYNNDIFCGYDAFVFPVNIVVSLCDKICAFGNCSFDKEHNIIFCGEYKFYNSNMEKICSYLSDEFYLFENCNLVTHSAENGYLRSKLEVVDNNEANNNSEYYNKEKYLVSKIKEISNKRKPFIWVDEIGKIESYKMGFYKLINEALKKNIDMVCCINNKNINWFLKIIDNKEYEIIQL